MSQELSELKKLITHLQGLRAEIAENEAYLKTLKAQEEFFATDIIPGYMQDIGVTEIRLDTGELFYISTSYFGNISQERAIPAFKWLRDNGFGAKIKDAVVTSFGQGLEERLDYTILKKFLEEKEIDFEHKEAIHAQTLKSTIKECMEKGMNFPQQLFGVHIAKQIEVEKPKTK